MRSPAGAGKPGDSAGGWFWGILVGLGILFWPTVFVHGPHRLPCEIGWYGFLGAMLLIFLIAASWKIEGGGSPRPKTGVPLVPVTEPPWQPTPDLRQSDVFEGKW